MRALQLKHNYTPTKRLPALDAIFREASKYPVLNLEQERTATPEQLINHNLLFVVSVAKRYDHAGVDFMDLYSEGLIGLIKASRSFNASLGFKFTSYAVTKIRAEITRYIDCKSNTVRVPDKVARISYKIRTNERENETPEELCNRLGISKFYYESHLLKPQVFSSDVVHEDGELMHEIVGDYKTDHITTSNDAKQRLDNAISKLTEREQVIIRKYYLSDYETSYDTIGEQLGLTRERIRQMKNQALEKLKMYLV